MKRHFSILQTCLVLLTSAGLSQGEATELKSASLTLRAEQRGQDVHFVLRDKAGTEYVTGAAVYELELADGTRVAGSARLTKSTSRSISIRVDAEPFEIIHEIERHKAGDGFVEHIRVTNRSSKPVRLKDYHFAWQRTQDARSKLRAVAVPFRRQADGKLRDWSLEEIAAGKADNSDRRKMTAVNSPEVIDTARKRLRSEGWILTDGNTGLVVAKYNNEQIEFASLSWQAGPKAALRLGGSSFSLFREPEAMQQLSPGQTVRLGDTFYFGFSGGWPAGYERFKQLLNEMGHGLSPDYRPPINWNELFDLGWHHSDPIALNKYYSREAVMREAAKAAEIGATMLYLDPGWEICEGTTLWDEARLGPVDKMVRELHERFKLDLSFRTIGRVYRDEFPNNWYMRRKPDAREYRRPCLTPKADPVPTAGPQGERNLALHPKAKANASSCLPGYAIHQVTNLNDGRYENEASWISDGEPSWAEIDLGELHTISRVRFGSEHFPWYHDHAPLHIRLLTATEYAADSRDPRWHQVAEYTTKRIEATRDFTFEPQSARWFRLEILTAADGNARIDEIEIYEAEPHPWTEPPRQPKAQDTGCKPIPFWEVCTQYPAWQREKADRIAKIAKAGMRFAMFDEFEWRGPCYSAEHGHTIPSTPLGHVRAIYGLIREVKRRVPELLVEAHDPIWPWGVRYLPVYFDQTLDPKRKPGSYDENWGFEFMWNPIEDLVSGRALCLYYYNLGCDIPLYDHITAEKDNDACLAFWWYASTVRHLGIGGKKGMSSKEENLTRWAAYKQAMARYRRLHDWFARGRFIGIDELTHLHVLPNKPGGVLVAFNLEAKPVEREVVLKPADLGLSAYRAATAKVEGCRSKWSNGQLKLFLSIPAQAPLVVEINPSVVPAKKVTGETPLLNTLKP